MSSKGKPFSAVCRTLLDNWIETSPDHPASPESIYRDVTNDFSIKMRLTLFKIDGDDPWAWTMHAVKHYGFVSRVLNTRKVFADGPLSGVGDKEYMSQSVIPRMQQVIEAQQPVIEVVKARLMGIAVGYDRIMLPQKHHTRPEWIITSTQAQFMLTTAEAAVHATLDITDEAIIQLLTEGATAKEAAVELGISFRTVQNRLERMKQRFGARNTLHLTAMLIANHLGSAPPPPRGKPHPAEE
jgi:DNA-binding CsgD family transcriptional regulator